MQYIPDFRIQNPESRFQNLSPAFITSRDKLTNPCVPYDHTRPWLADMTGPAMSVNKWNMSSQVNHLPTLKRVLNYAEDVDDSGMLQPLLGDGLDRIQGEKEFTRVRHASDPFASLPKMLHRDACNRGWVKMYVTCHLGTFDGGSVKALFNCELPGGFVGAFQTYLGTAVGLVRIVSDARGGGPCAQ